MKKLVILSNPITVNGARIILQSAVDNGVCYMVGIDAEYKSDQKIKRMLVDLNARKEQVTYVI